VAHSDLKAQNIFLHHENKPSVSILSRNSLFNYEIVLADFGFITLLNKSDSYLAEAHGGSIFYYAPEQVIGIKDPYNP
jgi:serine/threonine protein kinase